MASRTAFKAEEHAFELTFMVARRIFTSSVLMGIVARQMALDV